MRWRRSALLLGSRVTGSQSLGMKLIILLKYVPMQCNALMNLGAVQCDSWLLQLQSNNTHYIK